MMKSMVVSTVKNKSIDLGLVILCKSVFTVVLLIVNLFIHCVGTFLHF